MKVCENCGAPPPPHPQDMSLHDYCVHCSKDLCAKCMGGSICRENTVGHETESEDEE